MKKMTLILGLLIGLSNPSYTQVYYDTITWVSVNDESFKAFQGASYSARGDLNNLFSKNGVVYYEQAMPFAKTPELLKIHEIRCSSQYSIDSVIFDLTNSFNGVFDQFSKFEVANEVLLYDPVDNMYNITTDSTWLWHLKRIQANLAWDITKGSPNVKTAVIDLAPDVSHPDLFNTIDPHYDPLFPNSIIFNCINTNHDHGTAVSSFVSCETTEQGGVAANFGQTDHPLPF